uniref:Fibroblast growth factor n=1 Tax=Anser brachyrhynchus TaxID=132585 RepID=A0A8B9I424_9AVES
MRDFPRWELVLSQLRPKSPPKPQLLANPSAPVQPRPTCVAVLGSETGEKFVGEKEFFLVLWIPSGPSSTGTTCEAMGLVSMSEQAAGLHRGRFFLFFILFLICHADVEGTVIYFGISVILGILEIFAVSQGIVGIRGVFSNKFLAMSKKGKLHASARFTSECQFRERFQENSYNTYASAVHRGRRSGREWYVALNKRGKAKRGCSPRARPQHVSTHFLPLHSMV